MTALPSDATRSPDDLELQVHAALARADEALAALPIADETFLPASLFRARATAGLPVDPLPRLRAWDARQTRAAGSVRYRWPFTHKSLLIYGHWTGVVESWQAWRPRDRAAMAENRALFIDRFLSPIILADTIEWLGDVGEGNDEAASLASKFLAESRTKLRRDMAQSAQETHAWGDTWALWCVARRPRALALLHPFALAIAEGYADTTLGHGGPVRGTRFPFHDMALVSASAQLATGLVALGTHPKLTGALAAWVRDAQHADGGFGDADGPSDLLTTLVAVDLLGGLDPGWDPGSAITYLLGQQQPDGWWCAFGPETVWLTSEASAWLSAAIRPFSARFHWPEVALANRNRRTGLPSYDYYADLARLFQELPGLADAEVEVAFLDMAHFGQVNNRLGMAVGDACLREFAQALARIPDAMAIRDGGDEFLVVGAPVGVGSNDGGSSLADRLDAFRYEWPTTFRASFGDEPVPAARILVARTRGRLLVEIRDELGREIAKLKERFPDPSEEGVLVRLADGPASDRIRQ
jgi:GGDEF domain-containing protein